MNIIEIAQVVIGRDQRKLDPDLLAGLFSSHAVLVRRRFIDVGRFQPRFQVVPTMQFIGNGMKRRDTGPTGIAVIFMADDAKIHIVQ